MESVLKGVALTVDLSPEREVPMGCGQGGPGPWRVNDRIEANFLALQVGMESPVVLVSFDLLYVGPDLERAVLRGLRGLARDRVFIAATHTHAAPMTDITKPELGEVDFEYMQGISQRVATACSGLLDGLGTSGAVVLEASKGRLRHSINRRRWRVFPGESVRRVDMKPDYWGPTDEDVVVLQVVSADGAPLAFVWNYACHPVAYPVPGEMSAHFPGVIRAGLREKAHSDVPVLFFQGFSGNTRPRFLAELRRFPYRLKRLSWLRQPASLRWVEPTEELYGSWTRSLRSEVTQLFGKGKAVPVDRIDTQRVTKPLSAFASLDESKTEVDRVDTVSFQSLRLGRAVCLVGVSAEPVAEYGALVRRMAGDRFTLPVGCLDTPFGYAATRKIQAEGGYEAERFRESFGLASVSENLEERMLEGFAGVLELGARQPHSRL